MINYADAITMSRASNDLHESGEDIDDEKSQRTTSNISVGYNHYEPTSPMRNRSSNNVDGYVPEWPISHAKKADPMF